MNVRFLFLCAIFFLPAVKGNKNTHCVQLIFKQSVVRFVNVSRCLTVSHLVLPCLTVFHGVSPCLLVSYGVLWCLTVSPRVSWCLTVSHGVSQCLPVSHGVTASRKKSFQSQTFHRREKIQGLLVCFLSEDCTGFVFYSRVQCVQC